MIHCPACHSVRTVIHVGAGRRGRCLDCGATWIQEGAWQHSVTRPRALVAGEQPPPEDVVAV
jgi:transposase-like protein